MSDEENLLDDLLSVATEELNSLKENKKVLKDADIFKRTDNLPTKDGSKSSSIIHNGDTDSSDDEGNRNYENAKYNECGKEIKRLLEDGSVGTFERNKPSPSSSSWKAKPILSSPNKPSLLEKEKIKNDVYTDPVFGLRIVNPLISSTVLQERMVSREAVSFARLSRFLQVYGKEKDWVIAGVVANKSVTKTSQKGSQFCIWTLTDLKDDIKTASLFLFSSAYKLLWKTAIGTVVGILNPNVLDKKDGSKDEACLSVDNAQKVMIFGQSKDFGTCKSVKKNGENCNAIVNLGRCEFCVYHIKQEYQKCSKRSELQANFAGRGLTALRNKVLGKNEVFYAGKSYTAIPAKKNRRMEMKDNNRLLSLSKKGITVNSNSSLKTKNKNTSVKKQNASRLEVSHAQRIRDLDLLKKLGGCDSLETKREFSGSHSAEVTMEESKSKALDVISRLKEKREEAVKNKKCNDDTSKSDTKLVEEKGSYESQTEIDEICKLSNFSEEFDEELISAPVHNISGGNTKSVDTEENMKFDKEKVVSTVNKTKLNSEEKLASNDLKVTIHKPTDTVTNTKTVASGFPVLSRGLSNMIDLNKPITPRHMQKAKLNAINVIKKNGPIKKADPNSVKGSGKKRAIEDIDGSENAAKKTKLAESELISDRFKKMMAATSKHLDLLESRDDEEKEKYFSKMERKEHMEEKMATTFKVACKAVKCLKCKYTSFSASDLCKDERHPLKVFDAMKRFFKCGNCGNRIVSLDIVPTGLCKNCGSGKWEKTGMMKEKLCTVSHSLSIRGGEQKFTNSVVSDTNVCRKFNETGSKLLSRGFIQLEKRHAIIYKRVKSLLPRRESERRAHPLARHCDILQAVETRISMLNMTYIKYIESNLLCFIPGKVLDEMKNVLALVESDQTPPRTHQLLQELRDLSSMAMEHFDEHILPRVKEQVDKRTVHTYGMIPTCSKSPKIMYAQHALSNELHKVKKQSKTHKHHITFLTQSTQKLCQKLRKQNIRLKAQSLKIREQERKIQEQHVKIQEQEASLADIKKHIDEWDQKYNDLTAELVRARDDILSAAHSSHTSPTATPQASSPPKFYKSNIKPRAAHILPKHYLTLQLDLDRKRKSNLLPEIPIKRNRTPDKDEKNQLNIQARSDVGLGMSDLIELKNNKSSKDSENIETIGSRFVRSDLTTMISNSLENLLKKPLSSIKSRKRKMTDEIDLK